MSVTGVCDICKEAEGKHTCDRCGQFVCPDHYDAAEHACLECAAVADDPDQPSGFRIEE